MVLNGIIVVGTVIADNKSCGSRVGIVDAGVVIVVVMAADKIADTRG